MVPPENLMQHDPVEKSSQANSQDGARADKRGHSDVQDRRRNTGRDADLLYLTARGRSRVGAIRTKLLHGLVVEAQDEKRRRPLADKEGSMILSDALQREGRGNRSDRQPKKGV